MSEHHPIDSANATLLNQKPIVALKLSSHPAFEFHPVLALISTMIPQHLDPHFTTSRDNMSSLLQQPHIGTRQHSPSAVSPLPKKARTTSKTDDWSGVTEREERRRIQNRIAQRKFSKPNHCCISHSPSQVIRPSLTLSSFLAGEKARESREQAERDARNRDNAANVYRVVDANDIAGPSDGSLSGLPWGGIDLRHVFLRGQETSRRASGGNGHAQEITQHFHPYDDAFTTSASYQQPSTCVDSSGDDSLAYHEDGSPSMYDLDSGGRQFYHQHA